VRWKNECPTIKTPSISKYQPNSLDTNKIQSNNLASELRLKEKWSSTATDCTTPVFPVNVRKISPLIIYSSLRNSIIALLFDSL
jgi:hypothetical protein